MAKQAVPAVYDTKPGGSIGQLEDLANKLNDALNPFSQNEAEIGQIPFYQTGARAFIRIGGKPMAVCTDFRWSVSYQTIPIQTIDSVFPWDLDVGPVAIGANLTNIMDPTKGPEVDFLLPIMSSAVHQPLVEIQALDALGTSLFFARGMFTTVNGSISRGNVSTLSASFVGILYQHYVAQSFKPYNSIAGGLSGLANGLAGLVSDATGGLL